MFRSTLPIGWIKQRLPGSPLSGGRKPALRPRRWPGVWLRLEPLEDRTPLSVLVINDQTNPNPATWLVTASSVNETVQDQPPITQQTSDFTGVVINAGTGGNTFDVQSIAAGIPLTINSQVADTANLGNTTHGVQDILADVTLTNPSQATTLFADDSADTIGRSVSITSAAITGLAPGNINIPNGPCRSVTILGGSGGNVYQCPVGPPQLPAGLTIQGGGVAGALIVNDKTDTLASQWSITNTQIRLTHGTAATPQGPPQKIFYSNLGAVEIDGGSGGNIFSMPIGPPQVPTGPPQFTIQGGGVADALSVNDLTDILASQWSITGTLISLAHGTAAIPQGPPQKIFYSNLGAVEVDGGSGGNLFSMPVGPPQIPNGLPQFTIQGGGVADALVVNDQADTLASQWSITGMQISLAHGTSVTPVGPPQRIFYNNLGAIEIDGSSGGNDYTVDMATLPPVVTLKDTTGTDQVTIFAPPGNNVMTLTPTSLSATGGAGAGKNITFDLGATVTSFTINSGGTNQVVLVGNPPGPLTLVQVAPYTFSGFLPPLNKNLAFASGRTVPIKFQLTDLSGNFISSPSDVTTLAAVYPDGSTHAISGLRYNATDNQFIANWSTKGLAAGAYTISLSLLDGTTHTVTVQLAAAHSSAGMTTTAAGGTSAAPGGLLGGNIDLYVDNTNGDLTANELARIQDAVAAVDAVTEPFGVAVQEVTDPMLADVTLHMDSTSAVGGYADGVLGCTTDAGQITIIVGWNFYFGSDATQIGSAQYDFETVVTHELGHALGLGHNSDSTSVMYATLNTGSVNRTLTTADLNVADNETTGACGLHAAATPTQSVDFSSASAPVLGMPSGVLERTQASLSADSRQVGLNAVLVDLSSASDFSKRSGHQLNDAHSHLSRLSQPTIDDQDAFWTSAAGATILDRITRFE
jgi:hypothetical protein